MSKKTALVMSYAPVVDDARVGNQIRWLEGAGYSVDVLSRAPEHPDASGSGLRVGQPALPIRIAMHALLPPRRRFRLMVERHLPPFPVESPPYDLVLVNDHHLLPWATAAIARLSRGPAVLDMHELEANRSTTLAYRLLVSRYVEWMLSFQSSPVFTTRLTIAEGIADLHRGALGIARPLVVRNAVPFEQLEPSPVDPGRIVLVHHGFAVVERGIDVMLDAMLELDSRFVLVLMVIGSARTLAPLRAHPAVKSGRVVFRDPVPTATVARAINAYDLELAFLPPRFPNNRHALPNKFFEAIQGRLGVVIGHSPEMEPLVREHGFGTVVEGWTARDLALSLNQLTVEQIVAMKQASGRVAQQLSADAEGVRFRAALGI